MFVFSEQFMHSDQEVELDTTENELIFIGGGIEPVPKIP